jgi:hypothetical protein
MKLLVEMIRITKNACGIDARVRVVRDSIYRVLIYYIEDIREA